RFFVSDYAVARSDWSMTRLSNCTCARTVRRVVVSTVCCDEPSLAVRSGIHRLVFFNGRLAGAHLVGSGRCPDWMPPSHRDSPLSHRAFWVALRHRGKNASRLFVEKRMQHRYTAGEFRL